MTPSQILQKLRFIRQMCNQVEDLVLDSFQHSMKAGVPVMLTHEELAGVAEFMKLIERTAHDMSKETRNG